MHFKCTFLNNVQIQNIHTLPTEGIGLFWGVGKYKAKKIMKFIQTGISRGVLES